MAGTISRSAKEECSGWLIDNNTKIFIRDSKDRNEAVVDLNFVAATQLNKLMDYKSEPDTAATFAAQSAYVFPRPTDPTKHIMIIVIDVSCVIFISNLV